MCTPTAEKGVNPVDAKTLTETLNQAQQKLTSADQAYQTAEGKLRTFFQQMENRVKDAQKKLKDMSQKEQEFQTKLDQTLQTLEQEITKNGGVIASLSPGNSLSKKEQVAQKRVALLQGLKQVEQSIRQADQELTNVLGEIQQGAQQAQQDVLPVHNGIHDVTTSLNTLGGQIENLAAGAPAPRPAPPPAASPSPPSPPSSLDLQVLQSLDQAQVALLRLQQGLTRSQWLNQFCNRIEDFGRQHGLS